MKPCTYCGKEYSDEEEACPIDGKPLQRVGVETPELRQPEPQSSDLISHEERRFWERMTFRQFGILIIRLQSVWLLFYAVVDVTYLPRYFTDMHGISSFYPLYKQMSFESFLAIFRIIMNVSAAVGLIVYAERMLSWLVKDLIPKSPPNGSNQ